MSIWKWWTRAPEPAPAKRTITVEVRDCAAMVWYRHPSGDMRCEPLALKGCSWRSLEVHCIESRDGLEAIRSFLARSAKSGLLCLDTVTVPYSAFVGLTDIVETTRTEEHVVTWKIGEEL